MKRLIAILVASTVLPAALPAQEKQEAPSSRAGVVLFKMPANRQRKEETEYTALKTIEGAPKTFEIRIRPAAEATGTAAEALDAHLKLLSQKYTVETAGNTASQRHPAGFDLAVRPVFVTDATGKFADYVWVVQSGKKSAVIEFVADDAKIFGDGKAITAFMESCRLAHTTVLVAGDPALTAYDMEETIDFLQWLVDSPFTAEQREVFRSEIVDGWKKKDKETIDSISQVAQFRAELAKQTPEKQDFLRKQAEAEVVANARKDTDRASKLIVEIYDATHKPIAEGNPALTRQQADASLELFYFMAAQLEGIQAKPAANDKDEWAKKLISGWAKLDPAVKQTFEKMPTAWAATRAGWSEMTEDERETLKKQFAQMDFIKEMRAAFAKSKTEAGTAADAAALQEKITSNYNLTSSMLRMGNNSTFSQMASLRNMCDSRNTWRPR